MGGTRRIRGWALRGLYAVVFAIGCLGLSSNANANTTVDLAGITLDTLTKFGNSAPVNDGGLFTDTFTFTIDGALDAGFDSITSNFDFSDFSSIDLFTVELFDTAGGPSLGSAVAGGSTTVSLAVAGLDASSEFAIIVSGIAGSSTPYFGEFTLTAVPLPGALVFFGTALFGLVGIGRRRKLALDATAAVPVSA